MSVKAELRRWEGRVVGTTWEVESERRRASEWCQEEGRFVRETRRERSQPIQLRPSLLPPVLEPRQNTCGRSQHALQGGDDEKRTVSDFAFHSMSSASTYGVFSYQ